MELTQSFDDAQKRVKTLTSPPPTEKLLELYALYKQSTVGDVQGARPGVFDLKGRAKWDAWAKTKGMKNDAAMQAYVALVDRLLTS